MRTSHWIRLLLLLAALLCLPHGEATSEAGQGAPLPWEIWHDLSSLAHLDIGDSVDLRSSYCPGGCRFDRHSAEDSRFIRVEGDEGVIFEDSGPGAVTRIWMTMGSGVSVDLDPDISIRITLDDAETPIVDMPLPTFFAGQTSPFLFPMVGDRSVSSGGNFCYVPIPYRSACRISLVGAEEKTVWFQVHHHRLESADGVVTFTGDEDLTAWKRLLENPGVDPWPDPAPKASEGTVTIARGETAPLGRLEGPDSLTALKIHVDRTSWPFLQIALTFDGETTVDLPLTDFFAVGLAVETPTRSVFVGVGTDAELYCYFPMPFFRSASVDLRLSPDSPSEEVVVDYGIRLEGKRPEADAGLFGAHRTVRDRTTQGRDTVVLDLAGHGKWVGLYAEAGSVDGEDRQYLEGDERIFIDRSRDPALHGTGVEDFFAGGFYFRDENKTLVPFRLGLHGMTHDTVIGSDTVVGMYRLMVTDAPVFTSKIVVGFEGGPTNDREIRLRSVAYYYLRTPGSMRVRDDLEVGDPESRTEHGYDSSGECSFLELRSAYEGDDTSEVAMVGCYRGLTPSTFSLGGFLEGHHLRLRRLFDCGPADQRFAVLKGGSRVGGGTYNRPIDARRWQETEFFLGTAGESAGGQAELAIDPEGQVQVFSEFRYQLWSGFPLGWCDANLSGNCEAGDLSHVILSLTDPLFEAIGDPDTNRDGQVTAGDVLYVVANLFDS